MGIKKPPKAATAELKPRVAAASVAAVRRAHGEDEKLLFAGEADERAESVFRKRSAQRDGFPVRVENR